MRLFYYATMLLYYYVLCCYVTILALRPAPGPFAKRIVFPSTVLYYIQLYYIHVLTALLCVRMPAGYVAQARIRRLLALGRLRRHIHTPVHTSPRTPHPTSAHAPTRAPPQSPSTPHAHLNSHPRSHPSLHLPTQARLERANLEYDAATYLRCFQVASNLSSNGRFPIKHERFLLQSNPGARTSGARTSNTPPQRTSAALKWSSTFMRAPPHVPPWHTWSPDRLLPEGTGGVRCLGI